jgi:Protein of unknown function (DUF3667)
MTRADDPPSEGEPCLNCGEIMRGDYCHACGQRGRPSLHFHEFVHELVHEFLHFDSKIWRTLKLLMFFPGALTREYAAGRRARYVGPVRLFLVASVVLFGLLAFTKAHVVGEGDAAAADAQIALDEKAAELQGDQFALAIVRAAKKVVQDPSLLQGAIIKALSKSFFLLVPIFAWMTWRLFAKEQPFYVAHMYFALHFHAFAFVSLGVLTALVLAHVPSSGILQAVVGSTIVAYFYAALRRAYAASWPRTLLRGSLVLLLYSTVNAVVIVALFLGTLFFL